MRQLIALILIAAFALTIVGCSDNANSTAGSANPGTTKAGSGNNNKSKQITGFINPT